MDKACKQCGGTFSAEQLDDRFGGVCPKCLAGAALEPSRSSAGSGNVSPAGEPPEPPPLKAGDRFHGLEVLELLGRGGMSVVYKAHQPHLHRHVALKILTKRLAEDAGFQERFHREARALASLSHQNIVTVHDFGIEAGLCFLVMEFVDGVNVRQVLSQGKLPPEQALKIVPQLCDALQYAHDEGIVHRDIKPENILLDKKGRVKIADFGLAKILGGEAGRYPTITQTKTLMGTPQYMAPEQLENPKLVDHRADIYSMGVVFYEMLTGGLPIGKFPLPSKTVQVDVRLDQVVLRTLEKEPELRYQQASEVKEDVTQIVAEPKGAVPKMKGKTVHYATWLAMASIALMPAVLAWFALSADPSGPLRPTFFSVGLILSVTAMVLLLLGCRSLFRQERQAITPLSFVVFVVLLLISTILTVAIVKHPWPIRDSSRRVREIGQRFADPIIQIETMLAKMQNDDPVRAYETAIEKYSLLRMLDPGNAQAKSRIEELERKITEAKSAPPPIRFEDLFFSEDDLPGDEKFAQPSEHLPRSPFVATEGSELALVAQNLDRMGVHNLQTAKLGRAYQASHDWWSDMPSTFGYGYFALEAADEDYAKEIAKEAEGSSSVVDRWIHREGRIVLFAYQGYSQMVSLVGFLHVVNRLHEKLGLAAPHKLPGTDVISFAAEELPVDCARLSKSFEVPRDPSKAATPEEFAQAVTTLRLPVAPEKLRGISQWWFEHQGITVLAVDIPERASRTQFAQLFSQATKTEIVKKAEIGSLLYLVGYDASQVERYSEEERWALRTNAELTWRAVQFKKWQPSLDVEYELERACRVSLMEFARLALHRKTPPSIKDFRHQSLTALLLSLDPVDPEPEWKGAPPKRFENLVEKLREQDGDLEYANVTVDPQNRRLIIQFPGIVKLAVDFVLRDGKVVEFRLPKSGRRVVLEEGRWKYVPGRRIWNLVFKSGDIPEWGEWGHSVEKPGGLSLATSAGEARALPALRGVYSFRVGNPHYSELFINVFELKQEKTIPEAESILREHAAYQGGRDVRVVRKGPFLAVGYWTSGLPPAQVSASAEKSALEVLEPLMQKLEKRLEALDDTEEE